MVYFIQMFQCYWHGQPDRQIYVMCGKLQPALYEQLDLFTPNEQLERNRLLDEMMDNIRLRYGKDEVFWACSLMKGGSFLKRANHVGGHKG